MYKINNNKLTLNTSYILIRVASAPMFPELMNTTNYN